MNTERALIAAPHLVRSNRFKPREDQSPTQLGRADGCWRAWLLAYLYGFKPEFKTTPSTAFGSLTHACFEAHMHGKHVSKFDEYIDARKRKEFDTLDPKELVELRERAPTRALSAVHLLPDPKRCRAVHCETPLLLDTTHIAPGFEPIVWSSMSALDLVYVYDDGLPRLIDYKTTKGRFYGPKAQQGPWVWVPKPKALAKDVQFILEALYVMQWFGVQELWARWIYVLSHAEQKPQSTAVDVHVTWDQMVEAAQPWLALANRCRIAIRVGARPELDTIPFPELVYPDPDSPCAKYPKKWGLPGCQYHEMNDGICKPPREIDETPFSLDVLDDPKEKDMTQATVSPPESPIAQRLAAMAPAAIAQMPPEGQAIAAGLAPAEPPPIPDLEGKPKTQVLVGCPQVVPADTPIWGPVTGVQAVTADGFNVSTNTGVLLDSGGHPMPAPVTTPKPAAAPPPPTASAVGLPKRGRKTKQHGAETTESWEARKVAQAAGQPEPSKVYEPLPGAEPEAPPAGAPVVGEVPPPMVVDNEPLLRWFKTVFSQTDVGGVYLTAAESVCGFLPPSTERTVALRKLLESRDAAARAAVGSEA